jgi:hypothetical protein
MRPTAVGREGNILERLGRAERAHRRGDHTGRCRLPPGKARAEVEEIAAQVNQEPREASVRVVGSQVEVVDSAEGYELDVAATMRSVGSSVEDLSGPGGARGRLLEPQITTAEAETAGQKARSAVSEQLVFDAEGKSWTLSPADIGSSLEVTRETGTVEVGLNRARLEER